jgi:uncharacterized membrane protein (DUF2068 family)
VTEQTPQSRAISRASFGRYGLKYGARGVEHVRLDPALNILRFFQLAPDARR